MTVTSLPVGEVMLSGFHLTRADSPQPVLQNALSFRTCAPTVRERAETHAKREIPLVNFKRLRINPIIKEQ
jgi:hypothetical protein